MVLFREHRHLVFDCEGIVNMHSWQIAIRLLLIANCFGSVHTAIKAVREHHRERLHWLIPKAAAWALLFFALLPARYGGIGRQHYELSVWISIVLLFYGITLEMTDSSSPALFCFSIELPHLGRIEASDVPLLLMMLPVTAFLLFVRDVASRYRVTPDDGVILVMLSLLSLFGFRLFLRQHSLSRLSDLVELAKPQPPESPAQHDWIKTDRDDTAS